MPDSLDTNITVITAANTRNAAAIAALQTAAGAYRDSWQRPADRPPFHGFGSATAATFLVHSAAATTLNVATTLLAGLVTTTVVNNLTTGDSGTLANPIPVAAGYNWIEVISTATTYQIIPFNYTGPEEFVVCELYITHSAAGLNIRPVPAAFGAVNAATLAAQTAYNNSIEYFYYEGPKSSWSYYFSALRNLKQIDIYSTAATAALYTNTANACPDLLTVHITGPAALGTGFKHLNLGEITISGTATTLTGFLSYSRCKTVTLTLTAPLTAAAVLFAGSKFGTLTGTLSITNTAASTLAFFAMPMPDALALADFLAIGGAGSKTLQFGFANGFDPDALTQAIARGYTITIL